MLNRNALLSLTVVVTLAAALAVASRPALAEDAPAAEAHWLTSVDEAFAESAKTGKPVMADITGSDWCIWCQRLNAEVFRTDEFKKWAGEHVVLLELDFPKNTPQPAELKAQNAAFKAKYAPDAGYPTLLFMTPQRDVIGAGGYVEGGPKPWIAAAEGVIAQWPKLKPHATLADGQAAAAKTHKPLLVLYTRGDKGQAQAAPMFNDMGLIRYLNFRVTTVQIKADKELSKDEAAALAKLEMDGKLPAGDFQLLALDGAGKAVYTADKLPADLKAELEKALPPIPYNGAWTDDYETASLISGEHKLPMLLAFTISDLPSKLPAGAKLMTDFFPSEEFKTFAKDKLVLVCLDFPRTTEVDGAVMMKRVKVARQFMPREVPTIVLLDPSGKELGRVVYKSEAPKDFVETLQKLLK
ncbi:MAG: hypothetical protein BIFFINMI_01549 [Phycisphaerae bacterium]|nr:hypothetical protein [Phycisphaerae bacterium]